MSTVAQTKEDMQEEIARLRAELQNAAKAALDAVALSCAKEREADRLRTELEVYRKDAERYWWLIQSLFSQWFAVGEAEIGMRVYGQCPSKEVVESAIDAAMGASA
ncbi:hypothetical protein [Stenotrophomonas maltophilia]|uniref:hypothetical protein n=1 Tax=Stenotrophomonas maltophilia TaxID=40324 RepID=UPI003B5DC570